MAKLINSKEEFKNDILGAKVPAMVDFFATWCGPCKMIGPVIEELVEEMKDKAIISKLDIDAVGEVAVDFDVRVVPTIIFFKDGKEVERIVGPADKEDMAEKLKNLM